MKYIEYYVRDALMDEKYKRIHKTTRTLKEALKVAYSIVKKEGKMGHKKSVDIYGINIKGKFEKIYLVTETMCILKNSLNLNPKRRLVAFAYKGNKMFKLKSTGELGDEVL